MIFPQRNKLENEPPEPQLQEALKPALTRVRHQSFITWLERGLSAGLCLVLMFLGIARVWPWYGVLNWCLWAGGMCLLLTLLMAVINRPGWYSAAVWLDDAGLLERAVTALENRDKNDGISRLQYQDALQYIKRFNPQTQPYRWSKKRLGLSAAAAALVLIMAIIPNPQQFEAEQQEMARREALRQKHKIEKVRKKMEQANKAAPLAKREDAIKSLQELERQLERARNLNQGLKAVAQTQDHLMKLQTPRAVSDTQHLAAVLKQQEMTKALGQKIAAGDVRGSREASEKLLENAAAMTAQQRQAAASELSQQAVHLTPAASQLVQMLARAVRSGQGAAASPAVINQLSSAAGQAAAISALNQALAVSADARQALLKTGAVRGAQLAVNGSSGDAEAVPVPCGTGQEGGCGKNDRGASNTSGLSTTGTQNISQGNANGGSGQGSGGGAGQGSGQGSNNRGKESSPNSAPAAKGQPAAKFGNYEKIYDPSFINSQGEKSQVRGQAGKGPEQSIDTAEPLPIKGSQRPYKEVVGEYSQQAREALDRSFIPPGMAEIVKGYFSSLEE